jgi:hypothetical protein
MTRGLAALLLLVVLLAPMLAAANVPDPTWIGGLYDGDDGDEILALVWDGTPAVVAAPPVLCAPRCAAVGTAPAVASAPPPLAGAAASRAPPLA